MPALFGELSMRKVLFAAALFGGLLATAAPSRAELAEGDSPPDFTGKEFVNTAPCSFKSLRGHVVLVEIFRTW
jgi:hypothetical protein